MPSIKNELTGTWELLSYIEINIDGSDSYFPLGTSPAGFMIYSADGFMSLQIYKRNQPAENVKETETFLESDDEIMKLAPGFLNFSASYHIDNGQAIVSHKIMHSLNHKLEGKSIDRYVTFDSDILYLKSTRPVFSQGKMVNSYMTWKRLQKEAIKPGTETIVKLNNKMSSLA